MALSCRAAGRISLAALGNHAGEAERLELEAHLASCQGCAEQHATLLGIVRPLRNIPPTLLTPDARDFVRLALASGKSSASRLAPRSQWQRRLAVSLVLTAATAVGLLALSWRQRAYRVLEGDVALQAPAALVSEPAMVFRSVNGGRVQLDDALVDLVGTTEIAWNTRHRRVDLRRGTVTVDVKHHAGRHWEIGTPRFTVEVVGTRFTVGASRVSTQRGVVRVIRPDGSTAARVEAGESWSIEGPTTGAASPAAEPAPATTAQISATTAIATATAEMPAPATATATPRAAHARALPVRVALASAERGVRTAAVASAGRGLGEARRALARGDAPAARRLVAPLFHLGRDVAAEARVIFAESFLVEGRYADAIDGYRLVVRDFPATHQGESAAFAIAELESEHGRSAEARAALQGYLARYPRGRFVREAALRLDQLSLRER